MESKLEQRKKKKSCATPGYQDLGSGHAEIKRMATEAIIESCNNRRGFNSPVFAVRKKNGSVRVVANFKRTLNKVLVDLDPYPMPRIDYWFNRIGESNKYFASLDHSGYRRPRSPQNSVYMQKPMLPVYTYIRYYFSWIA